MPIKFLVLRGGSGRGQGGGRSANFVFMGAGIFLRESCYKHAVLVAAILKDSKPLLLKAFLVKKNIPCIRDIHTCSVWRKPAMHPCKRSMRAQHLLRQDSTPAI